ncbi:hypothetical protein OIU77_006125 [Salix suchowensis]|uniref:Photosystem II protein L n=1 Tax=Salix suchowensis TaxID=1278906 RepID=A0ABQ9ART2_9ROSI|nr:hypothetical protein OIU77_006125 [Salix suchowensis]
MYVEQRESKREPRTMLLLCWSCYESF